MSAATPQIHRHTTYILSLQRIARHMHRFSAALPPDRAPGGAAAIMRLYFDQPAMAIAGGKRILAVDAARSQLQLMLEMLLFNAAHKKRKQPQKNVRFGRHRAAQARRRKKARRKTPRNRK